MEAQFTVGNMSQQSPLLILQRCRIAMQQGNAKKTEPWWEAFTLLGRAMEHIAPFDQVIKTRQIPFVPFGTISELEAIAIEDANKGEAEAEKESRYWENV